MKRRAHRSDSNRNISRRDFFRVGSAAVAGGTLAMCSSPKEEGKIKRHRVLGRTGFKVSDIAMGGTRNRESDVVRYAYDKGVNYFDTGERYVNGQSEKIIGDVMQFMDRKKIFITTKIHINENDTEETVLDRFQKCQERLQTEYIDAFFTHGVTDVAMLDHKGFHSAVERLKSEGRVRFIGLSCHGSHGNQGASMEEVLLAAAEDGRFDIMLLIYNFMNAEVGEKVLKACKKKNIGTTAMKTSPGVLEVDPFDPENPTEQQKHIIDQMLERGMSKERIIERMKQGVERQREMLTKTQPFAEKYQIKTDDELKKASIQWVLNNPDMHTVCVSFSDFEQIDKIVPISGTELSLTQERFLEDYRLTFTDQYCRHGCRHCSSKCPEGLAVSSIMRYAYYYEHQGREKYAMGKYKHLNGRDGLRCVDCDAPCKDACPYGVDVKANMMQAHSRLKLV